jgi:hypothetical protein
MIISAEHIIATLTALGLPIIAGWISVIKKLSELQKKNDYLEITLEREIKYIREDINEIKEFIKHL